MLIPDIVCVREVINNMTQKTTKAELVALVEAQKELIVALEKKDKKSAKKTVAKNTSNLVLTTAWQTLAQTTSGNPMKNSISVSPSNFDRVRISMKGSQLATKTAFDELRSMLDIAQNKLEKAGLLTQ